MGCLNITLERIGGSSASARRIGGISVAVGMVCSVDIRQVGIIWASDGKLITLEGGYLIGAFE